MQKLGANLLNSTERAQKLREAARHHIESFDMFLEQGLGWVAEYLAPVEISKTGKLPFQFCRISVNRLSLGKPTKAGDLTIKDQRLMPTECRLAGHTYSSTLLAELVREMDGETTKFTVSLGEVPVMVGSQVCHLRGMSSAELIREGEDLNQLGGYFIINGNEKVVRMLIMQKQNYPIAFERASYQAKGPGYTQFAVQMRCVREDYFARTLTLHYLSDGNVMLRILYKKQEFLIPLLVILRALAPLSDLEFRRKVLRGRSRLDVTDRLDAMIASSFSKGLTSQQLCLQYIGQHFRNLLGIQTPCSDFEVGEIFLKENICVHLESRSDKQNVLCLMLDKLFDLASGLNSPQNLDALSFQEVLLGGHLYLMILREQVEGVLQSIRGRMLKDAGGKGEPLSLRQVEYIKKVVEGGQTVGARMTSFLSTGTIKSVSGLDLMQDKGFVVMADKLNNFRFLSHFRSVHRGAYFAEMKTTTVRKLLPESWGFLCPVHTPDGAPCGLLNHITIHCRPLARHVEADLNSLELTLFELGLRQPQGSVVFGDNYVPVLLDGKVLGYVEDRYCSEFCDAARQLKVRGLLPELLEVAQLKRQAKGKTPVFPLVFLSLRAGRLTRPVKYLPLNEVEHISPMEQLFLRVANPPQPIEQHSQLAMSNVLSILPQHIPFINHNQSPRNMYQCQMAKQTLGTAVLNYPYRADNKIYRILASQIPIVRARVYEDYGMNFYNSGVNAVVAVLSYTGYDMEDAMIINKSSWERGLGAGLVYKTLSHQLLTGKRAKYSLLKDAPEDLRLQVLQGLPPNVDSDGLCKVGSELRKNSVLAVLYDRQSNGVKKVLNKENEPAHLDQLHLVGNQFNEVQKLVIRLRFDRRGVIGDKFSSRHGQKGVLSLLYPCENMPVTEQGIVPDIIINPHAFPSRMTIGMLLQSLVAKTSALEGKQFQYEQWQEYKGDNVAEYYGERLVRQGFKKSGSEAMYSGITGQIFEADIFIGIVYYQRLRHMVSDKSQARSTGPCDILTNQPLKGRKKGGGIRVGQMERDAFLSHGLSFAIHERLFLSSDYSEGVVCKTCGSIISSYVKSSKLSGTMAKQVRKVQLKCACKGQCVRVAIPFVLRYLANQLAVLGVRMRFQTQ